MLKTVQQNRESCSGCSACRLVCAQSAISMGQDEEGFLVPLIDSERCIECGACRAVCPMTRKDHEKGKQEPEFYAAIHESEEVLLRSTSGGAFTALSDALLGCGGVVYGVDFDEKLNVVHKRADTYEQRDRMRFSKYIQSDIGDTYAQALKDLQAGKKVLFTGTPCQIAGLKAIAGEQRNLYLCDLVCHGVPSPLLWDKYRETLEREAGGHINWVSFRTKANGWYRGQYQIYYRVDGKDGQLSDTRFFELFLRGRYLLRPGCYACPYGDTKRASDITIADYWGIEKFSEQWTDRRGVSLVLTHTEKGRELLASCNGLRYEKRAPAEALSQQPRLKGPVAAPEDRELFWTLFREKGFAIAAETLREKHPEIKA